MNKNFILIDTSYTLFHRYFATLRWLSLAHNDIYKEHINDKEYNWIENEIFCEKYKKLYFDSIIKLVNKKDYKKFNIIFCMDNPKDKIWRTNELNCNYKSDRIDMSKKTNLLPTFKYTYDIIIPNLIKENENIFKIKLDKLEADDIIAVISNYLKNNLENKIYIISADEDFKQLFSNNNNLFITNFKTKNLLELKEDEAIMCLHRKKLLGDKSDCIKSIFPPKFSIKIKKKILESIDEFNKYINSNDSNKEIQNRYNDNSLLIDFNNIPDKYVELIIDNFTKLDLQ
jgi:hypothetical protein